MMMKYFIVMSITEKSLLSIRLELAFLLWWRAIMHLSIDHLVC